MVVYFYFEMVHKLIDKEAPKMQLQKNQKQETKSEKKLRA